MTKRMTEASAWDASDPLKRFRQEFDLPEKVIYLDGNSLGALPKRTPERLERAIRREWGEGLINSWLGAAWVSSPRRIGDKIATLIGAAPGEVIVSDSTSVNLFKAIAAGLGLRHKRSVILSETTNFPTDVYMMQGLATLCGGRVRAVMVPPDDLLDRLGEDVAILVLTQVHYKSGAIRDMAEVTRQAHAHGALVVWDLSHSAGAIEVDLNGAEADFAVGCGYKFLNGGPGAPAYIFVASRHQGAIAPVLSGWFGHARPFAFEEDYAPAPGIDRFLCGTPSILGLSALECGVDLMREASMTEIRRKSIRLGELFIACMEERCADYGFSLVSPRDPNRRGSQISYAHPQGYEILQALKASGVIGDFRAPNILRFGLTPLYTSHRDVVAAVEVVRDICASRLWDRHEYRTRAAVT